ncbi:MAG TPA: hypothetical protein VI357_12340 [Mycobacteriales bacterium]
MKISTRLAGLTGAALLTVLLAACGSDRGAEPASPTGAAGSAAVSGAPGAPGPTRSDSGAATRATVPQPSKAEPKPARASAGHSLGDGSHEARIVDVDAAGGRVTVDVVDLLTGAEAARAAAAAGAEVPPPNDYYISNISTRLRTLPVAAGAPITVNVHAAAQTGSSTENVGTTLPRLAAMPDLEQGLFRLTVLDGQLTRIAEIYLP